MRFLQKSHSGVLAENNKCGFYRNLIRQFWQKIISAVFTEISFVSFGRKSFYNKKNITPPVFSGFLRFSTLFTF